VKFGSQCPAECGVGCTLAALSPDALFSFGMSKGIPVLFPKHETCDGWLSHQYDMGWMAIPSIWCHIAKVAPPED
jgi:hypothetical protein